MNGINEQLKLWGSKTLNKVVIIVISGKAGVGKTTSANYMNNYLRKKGFISTIVPFALGVKNTAKYMGWDGLKDDRGRNLLQEIGKLGREYKDTLWAEYSFPNCPLLEDFQIADDWRFPNEEFYLENLGGVKVFKVRIESPEREILKDTRHYNDISETSLPSGPDELYDFVIFNVSSLDDLDEMSKKIIDTILDLED